MHYNGGVKRNTHESGICLYIPNMVAGGGGDITELRPARAILAPCEYMAREGGGGGTDDVETTFSHVFLETHCAQIDARSSRKDFCATQRAHGATGPAKGPFKPRSGSPPVLRGEDSHAFAAQSHAMLSGRWRREVWNIVSAASGSRGYCVHSRCPLCWPKGLW